MNIKLSFESAMQFVPCQQFLIFGGGGAGGSFKNAVCRNGWLRYSLIVSHLSALLMGSSFPTGKFQLEETRFGWKPILDVPWKGRSKNDPYLWGSLDGGGRDFHDKALSCMEDLLHTPKVWYGTWKWAPKKRRFSWFHHHLFASMFTFGVCISFGFSRGFFQALGFFWSSYEALAGFELCTSQLVNSSECFAEGSPTPEVRSGAVFRDLPKNLGILHVTYPF